VLDLNYFSFFSNPNPNPTHLPKHQSSALIISFLSVFDMQNITLCMRTWREVRNFARHRITTGRFVVGDFAFCLKGLRSRFFHTSMVRGAP